MVNSKLLSVFGILLVTLLSLGLVSATTVTLNSPADDSTANVDTSIDFTFTLDDASGLTSCTLEGAQGDVDNTTALVTGSNTISKTISSTGDYEWGISCTNGTKPFKSGTRDLEIVNDDITCPISNTDLNIDRFEIDNFGDGDDDEWFPLDEIEVEVRVENENNDADIDDVQLELFVYDSSGDDVTDDFFDDTPDDDLGKIKEDDKETVTFTIDSLDPEIEEGDYIIYAKAESDDDNNCSVDSFEFSVEKQWDRAIIPKDGDMKTLKSVEAGQTVGIEFEIYNVGEDEEDNVLVIVVNRDLGILERFSVRNLDVGDKEQISFPVEVPSTASAKTYSLEILTYFDYDDGDVYQESSYDENSFDDMDEEYSLSLKVTANPQSLVPTISATLESEEAKVGEPLAVEISIQNNGESGSFIVTVDGHNAWASLESIEPSILSISKGATGKAMVSFTPEEAGNQEFTVNVAHNGQVTNQDVSVSITEKSGFLTGFTVFSGDDSGFVKWLVIGIIVLVVLIVLVLVIKLATGARTTSEEF